MSKDTVTIEKGIELMRRGFILEEVKKKKSEDEMLPRYCMKNDTILASKGKNIWEATTDSLNFFLRSRFNVIDARTAISTSEAVALALKGISVPIRTPHTSSAKYLLLEKGELVIKWANGSSAGDRDPYLYNLTHNVFLKPQQKDA